MIGKCWVKGTFLDRLGLVGLALGLNGIVVSLLGHLDLIFCLSVPGRVFRGDFETVKRSCCGCYSGTRELKNSENPSCRSCKWYALKTVGPKTQTRLMTKQIGRAPVRLAELLLLCFTVAANNAQEIRQGYLLSSCAICTFSFWNPDKDLYRFLFRVMV